MALSVTQYTDFPKAFFTLKISYRFTVNSTTLIRVPCKPYDILAVGNVLLQSVHCVTNSVTCSPVQRSQQAAAVVGRSVGRSVSQSLVQTHNKQ
jgi:hypothetical protein